MIGKKTYDRAQIYGVVLNDLYGRNEFDGNGAAR